MRHFLNSFIFCFLWRCWSILLPDKTSLKFQYCKIATVSSHYIIIQWGCNILLENQSGENVGDNRQGSPLARGDSGSGKKSDLKFNKYFRRALYWQIVFSGNSNNRLCFKRGWLVFKSVWLNNVKSEHGCQTDNSEKEEEGKVQLID